MAPIMLGIEVFGGNNMLAFVVVCSLAYVVNGNRSIYGAQENIEKLLADSFITMLYNTAILDYVYDNFEELS